jgi:hypothetical protein
MKARVAKDISICHYFHVATKVVIRQSSRAIVRDMKKVKTRAFSRFNANRAPSHGGTER